LIYFKDAFENAQMGDRARNRTGRRARPPRAAMSFISFRRAAVWGDADVRACAALSLGQLAKLDAPKRVRLEEGQRLRRGRVMRVGANQIHKMEAALLRFARACSRGHDVAFRSTWRVALRPRLSPSSQ
jgi:hypothetical protein